MKPVFKQHIPTDNFYPFSLLNDIIDLRIGILSIKEKWNQAFKKYPELKIDIEIPNNLLPDIKLFSQLKSIPLSEILLQGTIRFLRDPSDLFLNTSEAIESDFKLLCNDRKSAPIPFHTNYINKEGIFIEPEAEVQALFLDASEGPVYIGSKAKLMAGSILKGPISIGEGTIVKFGTCIYGGTSIGSYCTVGGEIKNANIMDYSNKAHHGYLGDSVIGKWCNLGAGTSVSNFKNNASPINIFNPLNGVKFEVGQKCGMIMGDFSKTSINSSINSGTIIGICANIFHSGVLLPKYIPDFSWGNSNNVKYQFDKLIRDVHQWMALKKMKPEEELIQKIKKEYYK